MVAFWSVCMYDTYSTQNTTPTFMAVTQNVFFNSPCWFKYVSLSSSHSTVTLFCQIGDFHGSLSGMTSFQEETSIVVGIYSQRVTMSLFVPVGSSLGSYEIIYQ